MEKIRSSPFQPADPGEQMLGQLPDIILSAVQRGMAKYQTDPAGGEFLFGYALSQTPDPLPLYRVLYKFYNRVRQFDLAADYASHALLEVARQCAWPADWQTWSLQHLEQADPLLASQALLALKARAFIALRNGNEAEARPFLDKLHDLDPQDGSGASVVQSLAEGM